MSTAKGRVKLNQFIRATPDEVFKAWTTPALLKKWFCAEGLTPGKITGDVKVGGHYSGEMVGNGVTHTASGTYLEIVPGRKLVFTHGWNGPENAATTVTVEFKDKDGGTELTLIHERFDSPEAARGHEGGWKGTLANLVNLFEKPAQARRAS